jgi:hypothetical protein
MPKCQPPKPRLTLRVGVTGHQPKDLHHAQIDALQHKIHEVLQILKQFALEHPRVSTSYRERDEPILRLVSSLAEGADRYAAHQAIALGYELQCPLPFARDQYANDFAANASCLEYNRLLNDTEHTTAILELDGSRDRASESYLAAGRVVLSQSDVLLAIWDGQDPRSEGGTAQIVAEAALRNILTIRIESAAPHRILYRMSSDEWDSSDEAKQRLLDQLRALLNPPVRHAKKTKEEELSTAPHDYFSEIQPTRTWGWFWIWFRNRWLFQPTKPQRKVPDFELAGVEEWIAVLKNTPAFSESAIRIIDTARLCDHYGWANGLAEYYGNLYRSAFAFNYLMGAFAVLLAFMHYALEKLEKLGFQLVAVLFILGELGLLITIAWIYHRGRKRRWHEKWIDYRLLAEYLRQLFFLIPLGPGELSSPHLPKYMSAGDPKSTWMYWHYLALRREIGLVGGEYTPDYLDGVRSFLDCSAGIRGQMEYHEKNEQRLEKLDARFRSVEGACFTAAIVSAAFALVSAPLVLFAAKHPALPVPLDYVARILKWEFVTILVGLLATVLPAFGAALAGIRSQAEFERVKKRSRAMLQTLRHICRELGSRQDDENVLSYSALNQIVAEAGQLMVDELLDWRIVFKDRPLPEPG